jgi:hypothetical protein
MTGSDILQEALRLVEHGVLQIDEQGNIWRLQKWINGHYRDLLIPRISGSPNGTGRLVIQIRVGNRNHSLYAHRLVYAYFHGGHLDPAAQLLHKDGDPRHNHPENLVIR